MRKILSLILVLVGVEAFSQSLPNLDTTVVLPSQARRDTANNFASAIDLTNNAVYICGTAWNSANFDFVLTKINFNTGAIIWTVTYDYQGYNDGAKAVAVDAAGDIYVTGYGTLSGGSTDVLTVKFDRVTGSLKWYNAYNGGSGGQNEGLSIALDNVNNQVYVAGKVRQSSVDFAVLCYDVAGSAVWNYFADGTATADDQANKIVYDPVQNQMYAVGYLINSSSDIYMDCLSSSGSSLWSITQDGSNTADDWANDVKVDKNTNIVMCGLIDNGSNGEYFIGKYNKSGSQIWTDSYDAGNYDEATALVSDDQTNYVATGLSFNGSTYDYLTIMWNASGTRQWNTPFNTQGMISYILPKIAVDTLSANNHFYVCGNYYNGTNYDAVIYQVDPLGTMRWDEYYNGSANMDDSHVDVAVDGTGRVHLACQSQSSINYNNLVYMRYSQTPAYFPVNYNLRPDTFSFSNLFYRNSGEILDSTFNMAQEVLFYTKFTNPQQFILKDRVAFCEIKRDSVLDHVPNDTLSRVDMIFKRCKEFAKVYPLNIQDNATLNYILGNLGVGGITNVRGASNLIVPNIYPLIDLHYTSNALGGKYFFVVKPGGDPARIQLEFQGATSTTLTGGNLKITSALGSWTFKKPDIYYVSVPSFTNLTLTTTSVTGTNGWVSMGANTYSITPGTYNASWPLVIEIDLGKTASVSSYTDNLKWSTYVGGSGIDGPAECKSDKNNNLYVVGVTESSNFPKVIGVSVFQNSYKGGNSDGFISKYNYKGQLVWSTFVGSIKDDEVTSLDFAANGDIYTVGSSNSTLLNKARSGAFNDDTLHGGYDGFIFQLSPNGSSYSWLTNYGGSLDDHPTKCKFDSIGNLFIAGYSLSKNIPVIGTTPQYTQPNNDPASYTHDGFIARFNTSCQRTWATFIGSSTTTGPNPDDGIYNMDFNAAGDLYVIGVSQGDNYPTMVNGNSTNFSKTSPNGADIVLTRFSNTGQMKWSTYLGGTHFNWGYGIKIKNNKTFITGWSWATDFPMKKSNQWYYKGSKSGYGAAVYSIFNSTDSLIHSSYICDNSGGYDVQVDSANYVYLSGVGGDNFPIVSAVGTYTASKRSVNDNYIMILQEADTNVVWSTFVGGNHDDAACISYDWFRKQNSIAIDRQNYLHLVANTQSDSLYPMWSNGGVSYFDSIFNSGVDVAITRFYLAPINFIGIKENQLTKGIFVYPNPTQSSINIKREDFSERIFFSIFNTAGELVKSGKLEEQMTTIDLSSLAAGMYILELKDKKSKTSAKFVKYD